MELFPSLTLWEADSLSPRSQDPITQLLCYRGHESKEGSCLSGIIMQLSHILTTYHVLYNPCATFHAFIYSNKHELRTSCVPDAVLGSPNLRPRQKGPVPQGLVLWSSFLWIFKIFLWFPVPAGTGNLSPMWALSLILPFREFSNLHPTFPLYPCQTFKCGVDQMLWGTSHLWNLFQVCGLVGRLLSLAIAVFLSWRSMRLDHLNVLTYWFCVTKTDYTDRYSTHTQKNPPRIL